MSNTESILIGSAQLVEVQSGDTSFSLRTWIIDKDGNEMVRADFSSNSWKYVDDLEPPSN
jgi:hypothetical protein